MFDTPVRKMMRDEDVLLASPETPVGDAARLMAARNLGAVMVVEEDVLIGIFTERDVVFRVVARQLNTETTPLADVMTRAPLTVPPDAPYGYALVVMQEQGFRHMPIVRDGKPIGIVCSRNAMDPEMEEFAAETRRREYWKKKAAMRKSLN